MGMLLSKCVACLLKKAGGRGEVGCAGPWSHACPNDDAVFIRDDVDMALDVMI
jgi:hypothetical protein